MKHGRLLLFFFLALSLNEKKTCASHLTNKKKTVLLDAGHGGHDTGAISYSGKIHEKNINLMLILRLHKLIKRSKLNVKIILSRKDDSFVELSKRSDLVRNRADICISIHCNASLKPNIHGSEVYIMTTKQLTKTSETAQRENSVIQLEKKYKETYKNLDPKSDEANILFSLQNNISHENSLLLAACIQKYLNSHALIETRGVKQDHFIIFYRSIIPAVLVEVGFISNQKEEKYISSNKGIKKIAESIFLGLKDFLEKVS